MNGSTEMAGNPERWRAWARRIAGRGGALRRRGPLAMALLRGRGLSRTVLCVRPVHNVHNRFAPTLRPQVRLAFSWPRFETTVVRRSVHGGMLRGVSRADGQGLPAMLFVSRTAEPRATQMIRTVATAVFPEALSLVTSIADRTRRIEERISRHDCVTVERPIPEMRGDQVLTGERRTPSAWPATTSFNETWSRDRQPPPPVSAERIAEDVMRQIDQRITAWRERMGRV